MIEKGQQMPHYENIGPRTVDQHRANTQRYLAEHGHSSTATTSRPGTMGWGWS